jgi:hypothetical protein
MITDPGRNEQGDADGREVMFGRTSGGNCPPNSRLDFLLSRGDT